MLAIPIDSPSSTIISELYGNAPYFALMDESGKVLVIENLESGNGPKCAPFLRTKGANSTLFYHMGEGVYKSFVKSAMSVYSVEKNAYSFDEIYQKMQSDSLPKLTDENYELLLDPGTTGSCKCGCNE